MKTLTIRNPWAAAIIYAGKDVECRSWTTSYRGPLLIHAGQREDPDGWTFLDTLGITLPVSSAPTGGIIGIVDLIDVVENHPSEWAAKGQYHWVLADPRPLPFTPAKGRLGLWDHPEPETPVFA
jgi:hypothetical protein